MIDVIDPNSSNKYGDTAEPTTNDSVIITNPNEGTIDLPVVVTTTTAPSATSILNSRGRGIAQELDDDGVIAVDEDVEEADEETTDDPRLHYHCRSGTSPLKASLLDYVLSEVANSRSMMDLSTPPEQEQQVQRRRKYAFNPEEAGDEPPHLSEYYEKNVIAVLNRCDPGVWGKCYSCGSQSRHPVVTPNFVAPVTPANKKTTGFVSASSPETDNTFWNHYYNYKSDYRTSDIGSNSAYQYHNNEGAPWGSGRRGSGGNNSGAFGGRRNDIVAGGVVYGPFIEGARVVKWNDSGDGGHGGDDDLDNCVTGVEANLQDTNMMEDEEVFTFDVSF